MADARRIVDQAAHGPPDALDGLLDDPDSRQPHEARLDGETVATWDARPSPRSFLDAILDAVDARTDG